jgi:hypothetical protein
MKVAILSESPADEAAMRILVEGILREPIETHEARRRSRGFSSTVSVVPAVLKDIHYQRTADALIVLVDADNSNIHRPEHDNPSTDSGNCRFCQIRSKIAQVRRQLTPLPDYEEIPVAISVAPPRMALSRSGPRAVCLLTRREIS